MRFLTDSIYKQTLMKTPTTTSNIPGKIRRDPTPPYSRANCAIRAWSAALLVYIARSCMIFWSGDCVFERNLVVMGKSRFMVKTSSKTQQNNNN